MISTKMRIWIKKIKMREVLSLFTIASVASCFFDHQSVSKAPDHIIDTAAIAPAEQLSKAYATIAAFVKPSVVSVFSEKKIKYRAQDFPFGDDFFNEFFGNQRHPPRKPGREYKIPQMGMGSGMLLDHEGNILTNYHVIDSVDEIEVQFPDEKRIKARVIGKDPRSDIAVIRVSSEGMKSRPVVTFSDSDAVQIGEIVLAIGAPFGLAQTVTHGIISAKGRNEVGIEDYEDFLQTDAPINPGNSGGPLVNTRGEIVGMNSAIATAMGQSGGVGFAIPSNMIKTLLPKLIKGEVIIRGELGVGIQNLTESLAHQFDLKSTEGVLISQIAPGSTAEKAGLKVGDVILRFDGKQVTDIHVLRNLVAAAAPGSKIKIEYSRDKKIETVTAVMGQQKTIQAEAQSEESEIPDEPDRLGLSVETLTKETAQRYHSEETTGVIITDIDEGSPAALAGLQVGDVIVQVNHKPVKKVEEFNSFVSKSKRQPVLLLLKRGNMSLFVSIQDDQS